MFRTIKSKLVAGILMLVFIIQASSFLFNYNQLTSVLEDELLMGAENYATPLFKSMDEAMKKYNGISEESTPEEISDAVDWSVKFLQLNKFAAILETQDKLKILQYINTKNISIGHSVKQKRKKPAEPVFLDLVKNQNTASLQIDDLYHVFVPFYFQDKQYGGMIFSFSNEYLIQQRNRAFLVSLGILLFFFIASAIALPLFINNILTNPIKRMITQMQEYAEGKFDNRIHTHKKDEISEIITALNLLIESLQAAFGNISKVMGNVEKGDLSDQITVDLKGDLNQLKNRINRSVQMLSQTMSQVELTSESVNKGATTLSETAKKLSDSTTSQATTLEEIASSMVQIGSQTEKNTQHSLEAQQISSKTLDTVKKGGQQMNDMLVSMNEIKSSSTNVSKIIKVIDEIAFQTNLLALNAAVEAARAGKYGKGFAVVAEEVRNLAARSAEAAKDTTVLIETSIKEIENGVDNANKTEKILEEVVNSVEQSHELATKIANSSQEQNQGISEINNGISQVNEIVQDNSAIAENTAFSSEDLLKYSMNLKGIIGQFNLVNADSQDVLNGQADQSQTESAPIQNFARLEQSQDKGKTEQSPKVIMLDDDSFGKY